MLVEREMDQEGIHFMKCDIEKLDHFINLVISKKITADDAVLFIWMASYAWKTPTKKRNPFTIPISRVAKDFEISEQSVRRRLKRLRDAKLIDPEYRCRDKYGGVKTFKNSKSTWESKKDNGGRIIHAHHSVIDKTFLVRTGKKEVQTFKRETELH